MKSKQERKKLILELMGSEFYVPMKEKELAIMMQVRLEDRYILTEILGELIAEGKIEVSKRGKYSLYDEKRALRENTVTGVYLSTMKGFGFIEVEGREDDLFVSEADSLNAYNGDTVRALILPGRTKNGRHTEAKIIEVLERANDCIVGTYQKSNKSFGFVIPDNVRFNSDIYVRVEDSMGAMDGHKVVVKLNSYGDAHKSPEGVVTEIIGHINDPGVDIMSIVKGYGLNVEFPEKVMNRVANVADSVSEADMAGREDLRDVLMVTIDGEDAKDLDDAVSLTMNGEDYVLGVHIADVSNYVQENSALDWEAKERGTSVYLVDRVIPMLPHRLSNGICSLNAGEDRLALSVIMTIDRNAGLKDYRIVESVINVNHRMNYTSVNRIIALKDETERALFPKETVDMLDKMYELSGILRDRRHKRGAIDFDFPESKVVLDAAGHPVDIVLRERNAATKLIEDFMLEANETVASHYFWQEIPFVYRTHETPDSEKIERLAAFINNFGFHIHSTGDTIHPKEIQKLMDEIDGSEKQYMIARVILRSMKQAKYSTECLGHFGLAAKYYCHFTSPIRRYPDLQIHRIIKDCIRNRMNESRITHYEEILPGVSELSSKRERRAEEAERETLKLKKVQYMENRLGEEFDGVISSITEWGMYVELPNTIEGMVRLDSLRDDHYEYDDMTYSLKGIKHGRVFRLGESVRIKVADVDTYMRTIDFEIVR